MPQPIQYERNLYLAAGVTTAREVGGDFDKSKRWQAESNAHTIISPRILVYPFVSKGRTGIAGRDPRVDPRHQAARRRRPEDHRHGSRSARSDHGRGAQARAAHRRRTSRVEETTAKDYVELGVNSIEHFYGVADAALDGIQNFPPDMNYSNEIHRFGRAGELYAQADPAKLQQGVDLMVEKQGRVEPDVLDLRGQPRPASARRTCPGSRTTCIPSLEEYFKGVARQPRLVLPRLDQHAGSAAGSSSTASGWTRCASSARRAA